MSVDGKEMRKCNKIFFLYVTFDGGDETAGPSNEGIAILEKNIKLMLKINNQLPTLEVATSHLLTTLSEHIF